MLCVKAARNVKIGTGDGGGEEQAEEELFQWESVGGRLFRQRLEKTEEK